ncbi:MAG: hypothetical protein M3072_00575 [Candidatus Dormibacteraeota bacterium]|nr:hypothetical protein [Candidatus Dormibacteraeota bacterium]
MTGSDGLRLHRLLYYASMLLLAELVVRPVAGFTISDLLFLAAVVLVVLQVRVARLEGVGSLPPGLVYGVLLFAVGGGFASLASQELLPSLAVVARFVYLTLVWFWLGAMVLRTAGHVMVATLTWSLSVAVSGVAAITQFFVHGLAPVQFSGRLVGLTGHPNDLGGLSSIALVPVVMLSTRPGVRLSVRLLTMLMVACTVAGIILSGSVGGVLASAVALCWFLPALLRTGHLAQVRKRYLVAGLMVAAAAGSWLLSQPASSAYSPISRIPAVVGNVNPQEATGLARLDVDRQAAAAIVEQPLLGNGLDDDSAFQQAGGLVHNMLLGAWFGGGLPAMVGVLMVLGSVALVARSVTRDAGSNQERVMALSLTASLLSFVVFGMTAPILYVRYGWVPGALLIALRAAQQRARASVDGVASPRNVLRSERSSLRSS